jgi:hypothetical protein
MSARPRQCKAEYMLFTDDEKAKKWKWICLNCGAFVITDVGADKPKECKTIKFS